MAHDFHAFFMVPQGNGAVKAHGQRGTMPEPELQADGRLRTDLVSFRPPVAGLGREHGVCTPEGPPPGCALAPPYRSGLCAAGYCVMALPVWRAALFSAGDSGCLDRTRSAVGVPAGHGAHVRLF